MRRTVSACGFLAFTSALAIALAVPMVPTSSGGGAAFAQSKASPNTITTVPDTTYGEGGTLTTISDTATYKVSEEVYRDKTGKVREQRIRSGSGMYVWVVYFDDQGKRVAAYTTWPVTPSNPNGEWNFATELGDKTTEIRVKDKATAEQLAAEAAAEYAKTGGFEPLVETNVEQPTLTDGRSQPYAETKVEQPVLKSGGPEPYVETKVEPPVLGGSKPPTMESKSASGGQTSAPKTCGDITDQATLVAMGCTPAPTMRAPTVNRNPAPVATQTSNRSEDDCIGNRACEEELIRRAHERAGTSPGMPLPHGPGSMPGGMMPGGMPPMPAR